MEIRQVTFNATTGRDDVSGNHTEGIDLCKTFPLQVLEILLSFLSPVSGDLATTPKNCKSQLIRLRQQGEKQESNSLSEWLGSRYHGQQPGLQHPGQLHMQRRHCPAKQSRLCIHSALSSATWTVWLCKLCKWRRSAWVLLFGPISLVGANRGSKEPYALKFEPAVLLVHRTSPSQELETCIWKQQQRPRTLTFFRILNAAPSTRVPTSAVKSAQPAAKIVLRMRRSPSCLSIVSLICCALHFTFLEFSLTRRILTHI